MAFDNFSLYLLPTAGLLFGGVAGFFVRRMIVEGDQRKIEENRKKITQDALADADRIAKEARLQAKEEAYRTKQALEKEIKAERDELKDEQKQFTRKREALKKEWESLEQQTAEVQQAEEKVHEREQAVVEKTRQVDELLERQRQELARIAGISSDEAKKLLMDALVSEARMEAAKRLVKIENEMRLEADRKGKNIIALAISRYAGEYVADQTVSIVPLPNDEMKGRIIGREGRNIRAIEAATGIDIIIDDTPEAVVLSSFNPVRREIARQALLQLIGDGRIHPGRIEEVVAKVTKEMEVSIREAGEQATFDVGAHGIHVELINLLGRLRYRTSYGQNVLQHSLEVAFLCGIMAAEIGVDIKVAKRAGLLHDIGKAVDHEVEGSHAIIGRDLAKKYGESDEITYAIGAHHEDQPPVGVIDVLVQAADALSGARPGARREMLQSYVKRLEDLEAIANAFKGVEKSYAIQAGRDLRIIVDSVRIKDDEAILLSQDIARSIEEKLTYPGQIRVTVIRETRAVEYAK